MGAVGDPEAPTLSMSIPARPFLALASVFAVLTAGSMAFSQTPPDEPPPPYGRAGALAVETALGRGITYANQSAGRTSGAVAEPWITRVGMGVSLGAGFWLEGALRGALTESFGAVRSLAATAGVRLDTDRAAVFSLSLRLGYDALLGGTVGHGGYVAASANLRVAGPFVVFIEGLAEMWPGASAQQSTANERAGAAFTMLATTSYLGGVRLSL